MPIPTPWPNAAFNSTIPRGCSGESAKDIRPPQVPTSSKTGEDDVEAVELQVDPRLVQNGLLQQEADVELEDNVIASSESRRKTLCNPETKTTNMNSAAETSNLVNNATLLDANENRISDIPLHPSSRNVGFADLQFEASPVEEQSETSSSTRNQREKANMHCKYVWVSVWKEWNLSC